MALSTPVQALHALSRTRARHSTWGGVSQCDEPQVAVPYST
jgi:hypothetical protein